MAGLLGVMLVRDPQERWPMRRVRDELQRLARGQQSQVPTRPVPARGGQSPTGVMPAVRTTPVAPIPQSAERHHRRWGLIALAAVLAVAAVVSAYYLAGRGTPEAATENPGRSASADPSEPTTSEPPAATPEQTKEQMDAFVTTYLATVTSDPEAAFEMLTPEFQEASGGYDGYIGYWGTVRSASPSVIESNPSDRTVGYTVNYVMKTGRQVTENVRLQLQQQDDEFLIAGEG